jgi:hypothetical protein
MSFFKIDGKIFFRLKTDHFLTAKLQTLVVMAFLELAQL